MLSIENIGFSHGGQTVLREINVEAKEGELIGIVGPNGAGKTTLLRLISGVLRPSMGRVSVSGTDLATLNASQRARLISSVPQSPQVPLGFRVLDLVLMGRNCHLKLLQWERPDDINIALRAMELTKTRHLAHRAIGTLSGGERQRALVALALCQEAPVLLLDEPTSNLDLAHQTGIMDIVQQVQQKRGGALVMAIHDLTLAAQYCDQLVMLNEGQIHARGRPSQVLTQQNVSRVYGVMVEILPHPQTGTPVVLPLPSSRGQG